ncbi:farnesyl pyrophosphate synthase-like, partial [Phlebotomus argentipes]|uniref:farnesyl pyrophosphate synthase-like n=1 Tax=Phlebotomus argentipes TaxID=94469 RepID=UPI002892DD7D
CAFSEAFDDTLLSKAKRDAFLTYFPRIVQELEAKAATIDKIDRGKHLTRVLNYCVSGGRKYSGIIVAETYKMLTPESSQTPENLKLAYYLGWCVEMFIDGINVADDIMDGGKTRRNKTCWYLLEDVKIGAINDSFIIQTSVYFLLRTHFGQLDCFMRLLELFNETSFVGYLGQHVDVNCSLNSGDCTTEKYEAIAKNIGSYAMVYFPVALGATLAGYADSECLEKGRPILADLGYFYMIQNDYVDCFGDHNITGKVGTDIREGKCRWLAVACMEHATPAQRAIMKAHYGHDNPEDEAIIKQLYLDVNLPQIYAEYSKKLYDRLMKNVEENSYGDFKRVYLKLIETLTCSTTEGSFI